MTTALLSIGEVADSVGTAVSTVRYYDKIGLIETESRIGGKRRFTPDTVGRVSFVQGAQEAGFSLDEIREILDDTAAGWRNLVDAKIAELTERRDRLNDVLTLLGEIRTCGCQAVATCVF